MSESTLDVYELAISRARRTDWKARALDAEAEAERLRHEKDDAELYAERLHTLLTAARSIRDRALDERDRWKTLLAECVALLDYYDERGWIQRYDLEPLLAKLRKVTRGTTC